MPFWWKKKPQTVQFQKWDLPGDVGHISLPSFFKVEIDQDDTLMAYRDEFSTLRVSRISFTKPGHDTDNLAKDHLRQKAVEMRVPYSESGDNGVMSYEERTQEEGQPLVIKYWYVGAKSTILIVSVTMLASQLMMPAVQEILDLMPKIIETATITIEHKKIVLDDREITVTEHVVDKTKQTITSFGSEENEWLELGRSGAVSLGLKYGSGGDLTPDDLDAILSRWMDETEDKKSASSIADGLGIAFGDFLVENHEFEWVVVTDDYGTDYGVRHRHSEVIAFPVSSAAKRIEDCETECFVVLLAMLLDVLGRSKSDSQASGDD